MLFIDSITGYSSTPQGALRGPLSLKSKRRHSSGSTRAFRTTKTGKRRHPVGRWSLRTRTGREVGSPERLARSNDRLQRIAVIDLDPPSRRGIVWLWIRWMLSHPCGELAACLVKPDVGSDDRVGGLVRKTLLRRTRRVMTDLHACLLSTPTVHTKASLCDRTRALGTITQRTHRRAA